MRRRLPISASRLAPDWRGAPVTLVALLGCGALLLGLAQHGVPLYERRQLLLSLAAAGLAALGLGWAARRSGRHLVAVLIAILALLFGLGPLAALLLTGATALAIGLLGFGVPPSPARLGLLLRLAAGLAALVGLLQLTAHLRVNWAPIYLGLCILCLVAARWRLRPVAAAAWVALAARPVRGGVALPALLLAALLAATLPAVLPESSYDSMSNHLIVVRWIDWYGAWHFDPKLFDRGLMPRGAGWLFAWAHLLGGEAAMKLLNAAAFWLTAAIVLAHLAEEIEPPPARLAVLAVLALAVTPLTVWLMTLLFEETVTTLFVTAALSSLALAWRHPGDRDQAMMTFLLLGAGCAAKVQALFFGGIGLLAMLALFRGRRVTEALRLAAAGLLLFVAIGVVPYVYAFLVTGNPLFPFTLGEPPDPRWIGRLTPDLLYRLTFHAGDYMETRDGAFGYQHLVLVPVLLLAGLLGRGESRVIAAALLLFALALLSQTQYARYLFYGMPGLLLLLGPAWAMLGRVRSRLIGVAPGQALLIGALAVATVLNIVAYRSLHVPPFRLQAVLNPERFARGIPEERQVVAAINATYGSAARVYFAGLPFSAGLTGRAITVYSPLRHAIDAAGSPTEVERLLRAEGITHVVTATPQNRNAAPAGVPAALAELLATRLIEVPTTLREVRLYAMPPP